MVELHQKLQRIEEHLSLVTRMLHVAAELIESIDVNEECDQGAVDTDLGLCILIFLKPQPSSSPNIPVPYLIFWHQTTRHLPTPPLHPPPPPPPTPQVGPSLPKSEMLHFNLSANSDSISVLRPLTGVFKVGQIEINHDVAENIKKVLAHRLDKEMRAKLDADGRLLSNCERI